MTRDVKLSHVGAEIESLSYPIDREAASDALADVTLQFADGEEALSAVVDRANVETFGSATDLESEVFANLPVEAVGEPGQSAGEG
ncbi:MAG: hypothetical protein ABEJ42_06965 [Halobacteriaceae archaeon]